MSRNILSLTGLHKTYGDRTVLDGVTLGIDGGEVVGLIGDNGSGKSTLLKIIAGLEEPDQGLVTVRGGVRVGLLEQIPTLPPGVSARQALSAPFAELIAAIAAYERAVEAMDPRADALLLEVERRGGWDFEHRVERAAEDVALEDLDAPVDTLSGGQRKRLAIARLRLEGAGLLLLDEPTNHVDAETVERLEAWILAAPETCVLVTHDRTFLERVVDRIVEIRDGQIRSYPGTYTDYLEARATEEALRDRTRHRRLRILESELDWARRSPKARTTKARARVDRIDSAQQEQEALRSTTRVARFELGSAPRLGKRILEMENVSCGFDGVPLLEGFSLVLRPGERLGIVGPNGCGKTTLLRLVLAELAPTAGRVQLGDLTRVAYFDQHRTALDPELSLRETLVGGAGEAVYPGGERCHVATYLERFAFRPETMGQKVSSLSGGERNRLAIARFLLEEANVLLLDEPTNDLDLLTLGVLEEALLSFGGCALVVSHDRWFLDRIATGIVAFEPHGVTVLQGGYTQYRETREAEEAARKLEAAADRRAVAAPAAAPVRARRGLSWREARELEALEGDIERGRVPRGPPRRPGPVDVPPRGGPGGGAGAPRGSCGFGGPHGPLGGADAPGRRLTGRGPNQRTSPNGAAAQGEPERGGGGRRTRQVRARTRGGSRTHGVGGRRAAGHTS